MSVSSEMGSSPEPMFNVDRRTLLRRAAAAGILLVPGTSLLSACATSSGGGYEIPWGPIMAGTVIVTIPLIVLVLIFQNRIISGLTAGAVKG